MSISRQSLFPEPLRHTQNSLWVKSCIGHVAGMAKFRDHMKGTAGMRVYNCVADLRRFRKIPKNDREGRWQAWREIQIKYFTPDRIVTLNDDEKWQSLSGISCGRQAYGRNHLKKIWYQLSISTKLLGSMPCILLSCLWLCFCPSILCVKVTCIQFSS